ncbi:MAG: PAS domain S-box protein [Anaerolineales bacterium]|nr:PAS domain S-box protein [Anaerolineales bacterium]
MIISFVAVVILAAVTAGLPAILLISEQLEQQAWVQVDQAQRAARALYTAKQVELENLATLTARRPTLQELLHLEDQAALEQYLGSLQDEAGLDLIVACDISRNVVASTNARVARHACESWRSDRYWVLNVDGGNQVWLSALHPVDAEDASAGEVIVAIQLDDEFAVQMREQTGLEHTLWVQGSPAASSFPSDLAGLADIAQRTLASTSNGDGVFSQFEVDDNLFYSAYMFIPGGEIDAEMALDVSEILSARVRLAMTLGGSILVVALIVSILGVYLAQRISKPLVGLANAAGVFQRGDLEAPVAVQASVQEIEQVARALEGARLDLRRLILHLQQEKAWSDYLLESIVEGIMTLDHEGRITYFSHGAENVTGWKRDQVLNRSSDEVFRLVEAGGSFSEWIPAPGKKVKLALELADGRQMILAVTGARLAPSEVSDAEVVLVFRDVSEEEMIHRLLGHFLANVAHEFRTPLSSLAASIELLFDQAPDLSAEELQELLVSLHLSTISLQTLMDNLLESASIEAGRFRVSPRRSDLNWIISETIRMMQPLLDKYGQRLHASLPPAMPWVWADERRMIQVLVNLLSNAIKYGPENGEIFLEVEMHDDRVKVSVADQGTGIPEELRKDIFRRFTYPRSLSNSARMGVGLGLWVVKTVVEAHDGQVGVSDWPGGGAVFWFTLPIMDTK